MSRLSRVIVPMLHAAGLDVRMVGRADVVSALARHFSDRRFVTIVGPGGIGKTTVALAAAHTLSDTYADGIWFVDLASHPDPALVPSAIASVVGLTIHADNPVPSLVSLLTDKQMLLVLDSCEHVIEATAMLAVELLRGARGVHILATSREPLRAEGERVQRLAPLGFPAASPDLTAAKALTFPAIQLFVDFAEIGNMGTVQDCGAKLNCLDRILAAVANQRAAHEHDGGELINQP